MDFNYNYKLNGLFNLIVMVEWIGEIGEYMMHLRIIPKIIIMLLIYIFKNKVAFVIKYTWIYLDQLQTIYLLHMLL
jgi:hypothetical protein